jgi:hypothetical protein
MAVETIQDGNHRHGGKNWFVWGVGLAIASALPFLVPILTVFRGISPGKATGLAAVAGGLTELYVTSGLILTFILPIAAIVLLGKSFSAGNQSRKLLSLLFICSSVFMLALYGLSAWFVLIQMRHLAGGPG